MFLFGTRSCSATLFQEMLVLVMPEMELPVPTYRNPCLRNGAQRCSALRLRGEHVTD